MPDTEDIPPMRPSSKPTIVVLGAGFAGVSFCRSFPRGAASITLVDRNNYHLFQPLLYQVATTGLSAADIAQPIRTIFRGRDDITVYMAEVKQIDLADRVVTTSAGSLRYDYLIIATGSRTSYFKSPQWRTHAPGLKSVEDALEIRRRLLVAFEEAEWTDDEAARRELCTAVIVGGGPTGVELAGSIAELRRYVIRSEFRRFDPLKVRVILAEGGERILPAYSEEASRLAQLQLEKLGVEVRTRTMVADIKEHAVRLGEETVRARTVIWTAGVAASETTAGLGVPLDRLGRIQVRADLSLPDHPEAFAAGDIVFLKDDNDEPVPGVAPAAKQMGSYLAAQLADRLRRAHRTEDRGFVYKNKGNMATIGRAAAVAEFRSFRLSGYPAWLAWLGVHLVFLMGMRNRLSVFVSWVHSYIACRRRARLIIDPTRLMETSRDPAKGEEVPEQAATGAQRDDS